MEPKIIAHRGASAYVKENTLAAFERAIALGADFVEFDVRRTRDRQLIVYHDPELNQRPIRKLTYAEVLQLDPDIPRLEAVLQVCKDHIGLDVELKETGYERQVMDLLLHYLTPDQFVITSFHPRTLKRVKRHYPYITTGFLFSNITADVCKSLWLGSHTVRNRIHRMNVDFVAPDWQLLEADILSKTLGDHWPIWVWTVNAPADLHHLMQDPRIAGIITDYPDVGLQMRDNPGLQSAIA